jgi:isocitrate dehydrogenase
MSSEPTIIYTLTDEAPLLATCSFLPMVRAFTRPAGVKVESCDISVAARILGQFPECLTPEQRVPDTLGALRQEARWNPTRTSSSCPTSAPRSRN